VLVPKLFTTLQDYDRRQFLRDLTAGVIVGIVALPLAIAFAIASGVPPERGLYTAIVAGFLISALGGSKVQIGGPTGAFVVIVAGIVQRYGYDGLALATLMAGVILIVLGLARFGGAIKFIPFPVTIGFTAGIAIIIFTSQVKDLLGLDTGPLPGDFVGKWRAYAGHMGSASLTVVAVSAATLAIIMLWPRVTRRLPGPFVALVAVTAAARLMHLDVETIGSRFGTIHAALPAPHLPGGSLHWDTVRGLVQPAFAIALLAAIESLLSAVVADGMIGGRHRSNMELIAQGIANIASPLFGGIPATGAIARTATNVKNGGRTPVAGIIHALTLLLITLFVGRWAALIPMAVLAAILAVVAYHMSEWRTFMSELRAPRSDVAVMLVTFGLTVIVDLTVAIEVGLVLASFLFMKRMAEVSNVSVVARELGEEPAAVSDANALYRRDVPEGVQVYEINGPFFFGAAESFRNALGAVSAKPKVLVIRMRNVPVVDSTGMHALRDFFRRFKADGARVLLSDVHAQPLVAMERAGLLAEVGDGQIFGNIDDALNDARRHLGLPELPRPGFARPTVARETPAGGIPRMDPQG
jgi:SulP family sulfate permease